MAARHFVAMILILQEMEIFRWQESNPNLAGGQQSVTGVPSRCKKSVNLATADVTNRLTFSGTKPVNVSVC